uniref:tRNA (34-2'-O)-methyltransferase regulator WDR6 n=1 Tax=Ascaris suum TaxID=6253 RepID=F1KS62_ASCSU
MGIDAFGAVLAITAVGDTSRSDTVDGEGLLLIGSGRNVDKVLWDNDRDRYILHSRTEVFTQRASNVYGIICNHQQVGNSTVVYGEKSVAYIRGEESRVPDGRVIELDDWIQTVTLLNDGSLAILFASNTVAVYEVNESIEEDLICFNERRRIRCSHKANLLYSLLEGTTWRNLRAVVGTVFGEILIWHPSVGAQVSQRLIGHTGMIFGLLLRGLQLFSISDDRSLRMWSMETFTQLDEAYGHFARPLSICAAAYESVITGGQDGDLCVWNTSNRILSLTHRIHIGRGAIRALLFQRNKIVVGTEGGLKCAVKVASDLSPLRSVARLFHKRPIRSFVLLSMTSSFILDADGILSLIRDKKADKVMECACIRHDSLLLSPCKQFITFCSHHTAFIIAVGDVSSVTTLDFPERITSMLWVGRRLLVACESGSLAICEVSKQMRLERKGIISLQRKEIPNVALEHNDKILIGTRKGSIIVLVNSEVVHVESYCHGKESVTDLTVFRSNLLSIGRDGKLGVWLVDSTRDGMLTLLRKRTPSFWIDMEWPCKFIRGFADSLLIAGFRGTNFVLIDYESGQGLCEVNCGGGHRIWQIAITDPRSDQDVCIDPHSARFEFISKGALIQMDLNLSTVDIISPNAHTSEISAVCSFNEAGGGSVLVTGGFDTHLVVSRITPSGYFPVLFRTAAHTSSIYSLSALDNFLISAGGKSQLFIWQYLSGELLQVFALRLCGDARLISVKLVQVSPHFEFVVAASDSRLEWYRLKKDLSGIDRRISLTSALSEHSVTTKVAFAHLKGIYSLYAVSTSGTLSIWIDIEKPNESRVFPVEKAGLSALDVLQRDDYTMVVVGSESGRLSAAKIHPGEETVFDYVDWHGATCTDVHIRLADTAHLMHIFSVALDSRIALFSFSLISLKLQLCRAVVLNVADPSSFCFIPRDEDRKIEIAVVGSSVQVISLFS